MQSLQAHVSRVRLIADRGELPPDDIVALRAVMDAFDKRLEALEELVDWQNGPPLLGPKWEPGWNNAMKLARDAIDNASK